MPRDTFFINNKFKELLLSIDGDKVYRKDLIKKASCMFQLTTKCSEAFIARNVHRLHKKQLLEAYGKKGYRAYHIKPSLMKLIDKHETLPQSLRSSMKNLLRDESKTDAELKLLISEIDAYSELIQKYPSRSLEIKDLLSKAKEQSTQLYGRLNAIRKLIESSKNRVLVG